MTARGRDQVQANHSTVLKWETAYILSEDKKLHKEVRMRVGFCME